MIYVGPKGLPIESFVQAVFNWLNPPDPRRLLVEFRWRLSGSSGKYRNIHWTANKAAVRAAGSRAKNHVCDSGYKQKRVYVSGQIILRGAKVFADALDWAEGLTSTLIHEIAHHIDDNTLGGLKEWSPGEKRYRYDLPWEDRPHEIRACSYTEKRKARPYPPAVQEAILALALALEESTTIFKSTLSGKDWKRYGKKINGRSF